MNEKRRAVFRTALGWAGLALADDGVVQVVLPRASRMAVLREMGAGRSAAGKAENGPVSRDLRRAVVLVRRFLTGGGPAEGLHADLRGSTEFQRAVWRAAQEIPYGETRSYGWIATRIGRPKAARAVGQAMGANPVPILVP